jgi:hypothetical protein
MTPPACPISLTVFRTDANHNEKHRNCLNPEPALILTLKKIRPPIEVLACQKQAVTSLTGQNHISNWYNVQSYNLALL